MNPTLLVTPRDEWIRILAGMGYGQRRLVELPPPPSGLGGLWEAAVQRIDAGAARLAAGDSGVSLAETRIATERLIEAIGESIGRPRNGGLRPSADAIVAELLRRHVDRSADPYGLLAKSIGLIVEIFSFASEPGHNAFDGSDRRDAELALSLITAVYVFSARLPSFSSSNKVVPESEL